MLVVHFLHHLIEGVEGDAVHLLLRAADRDGDGLLLSLLVADNDDVRGLLELVLLDLLVHVRVFVVSLDADAHGEQRIEDLLRVGVVLLADRDDADLARCEPERERAFVVLDQDAHEALQRSEDRAVQNDRLLEEAVLVAVGQAEVVRQLEVKLHGAALPFAAESVLDLEVDLRAVEGAVALVDLVVALAVLLVQNSLQGCLGAVPDLDIAHEIIRTCGELAAVGDAEGRVDLVGDVHDVLDLGLDLGFGDERVAVILAESLHAEEAVQLAGLLFSVDNVQLVVADRQLLVGVHRALVGHHRVRAVHRLGCVDIHGVLADRVLLALLARDDEHIVLIMCPVAGDQPELPVVDDRRGDLIVTVARMNRSPVGDQGLVDLPAVRQPVGHARCGLVEHEEVELRSQLLVVALLGLADEVEMSLELGLIRKCIHINSLQGITLLVASPVSAGCGFDLECGGHELLGVGDVRAAAEIHEVVAGPVDRDLLIFRQILDELRLELLVLEELQRLGTGQLLAGPVFLPLDNLMHLVLDDLVVILGDRARKHEIVVKTVRDLRADGVLHIFLAEDLDHCLCQHMGQRMSVDC